jgi:hypothetical protein
MQACCKTPHDPTPGTLVLCSVLHHLGQVVHFGVDFVPQRRQQCHVVGLVLPNFEGSLLPDPVRVELRPLLVSEPPRLPVQSNVFAPVRLVVVSAVRLVELLVHGVDMAFGVTDVLLEHPDVLQQIIAVGVPLCSWGVAAGLWTQGHV